MIVEENKLFRCLKPEFIDDIDKDQRVFLIKAEQSSKLQFIIPPGLVGNNAKQIYKVGFLAEFLKRLYPEKPFNDICEMMSDRYDIFLSRRQIDRNVKKFLEDSN